MNPIQNPATVEDILDQRNGRIAQHDRGKPRPVYTIANRFASSLAQEMLTAASRDSIPSDQRPRHSNMIAI
jgi:hypothetical protein